MIILIIALTFLILLVLFFPIKVSILFLNNKLQIKIFNIPLNLKKKNVPNEKTKKGDSLFIKLRKNFNSLKNNFGLIIRCINFFNLIVQKMKIKRLYLAISLGSNEAKSCIINWYNTDLLVDYLLYFFKLNQRIEKLKLRIYPNFLSDQTKISLDLETRFCIFQIFNCLYVVLLGRKSQKSIVQQKVKRKNR